MTIDLDGGAALVQPEQSGAYDLSGAIYAYDQIPGLVTGMQNIGFKYWRVGLGRWEIGGELFASVPLGDGGSQTCPAPSVPILASEFNSLDELVAHRDFFKLNVDHPPAGLDANDMDDPANYDFTYVDSVVAEAEAFGAEPYLDIDYVPKALSSVQTLAVPDCNNTFANGVTTAPPVDNVLYAKAVAHVLVHLLDGWPNATATHTLHYVEIGNEPENVPYFWSGTETQFDVWYTQVAAVLGAYRDSVSATDAAWAGVKIGGASFGEAPGNRNWLPHLLTFLDSQPTSVPLDFLSVHSYHDDPRAIVLDEVATVQALLDASHAGRYAQTERVLSEWGPGLNHLGDAAFTYSMPGVQVYAAGFAGAEATGYSFTQKALFYDYGHFSNGAGFKYGILDYQANPAPAYFAFQLYDQFATQTPRALPFPAVLPTGGFDGIAVGGKNAAGDVVQLYVVNLLTDDRGLALTFVDGSFAPAHATLQILDGTGTSVRTVGPNAVDASGVQVVIPALSVTLVTLQ